MLTFKNFSGINNVLSAERLGESDLTAATNVDIGLTGEASRRSGYVLTSAGEHANLFQGEGFLLATVGPNGDLTNLTTRVPQAMRWMRELFWLGAQYNIQLSNFFIQTS